MNPDEQIAELTAQLAAANATIDQRAAFANGLESQVTTLQAEKAALQSQNSTLTARVAELQPLEPPTGAVITVVEFQRRLIPARFRLPYLDEKVRAGWEAVFREVVTTFREVYLTDPLLGAMLAKAVADQVLSKDEAAAVSAHTA